MSDYRRHLMAQGRRIDITTVGGVDPFAQATTSTTAQAREVSIEEIGTAVMALRLGDDARASSIEVASDMWLRLESISAGFGGEVDVIKMPPTFLGLAVRERADFPPGRMELIMPDGSRRALP